MPAIPDQFPISLRAWPAKDDKSTALSSLISRINVERGSFRDVTEESLKDEIRQAENGIKIDQNEGDSEDETEEEPDRMKELMTKRQEMLGQLDQAHNAAMLALDFISLLLSKDTPVQAGLSISAALRDAVPLGTLGADKVRESRVTEAQRNDIRSIAKGWKVQAIDESVDSIVASASRLEKEIEAETKYWEEILSVDANGWAICHLPQEKHTLGVRFGFSEAAPTFRNRSLAALRRNKDGTVFLDQGVNDGTPKQLRVQIETNGVITGQLSHPHDHTDSTTLVNSVLEARNSIFEEELWQELNREARILASQGVRSLGNELYCPISPSKRIILDLITLDDEEDTTSVMQESRPDDSIAEMISLSLHLLLSFAHRQNLRRRSQHPPPISTRPQPNHPYPLLRPILTRLYHESNLSTIRTFLTSLSTTLKSTGLTQESYTFVPETQLQHHLHQSQHQTQQSNQGIPKTGPEETIETLISQILVEFEVPFTADQFLTLKLRTTLYPLETRYNLTISGPVAAICKPPPNPSTIDEVKTFILWAGSCAIARSFTDLKASSSSKDDTKVDEEDAPIPSIESVEDTLSGLHDWHTSNNPTILKKYFENEVEGREVKFSLSEESENALSHASSGRRQKVVLKVKTRAIRSEVLESVVLHGAQGEKDGALEAGAGAGMGVAERVYVYAGESMEPLERVVDEVGKWTGPVSAINGEDLPPPGDEGAVEKMEE